MIIDTKERDTGFINGLVTETSIVEKDQSYDIVKKGVVALIKELMRPNRSVERVNKGVVNRMIAEIDAKLSRQVDAILHHPEFQKIEATWRSLQMLIEKTDFTQNITIELLNLSKEDIADDFENQPDVNQSGLYKHIYTSGYGQFGGTPVGAIIADYTFSPGAADMKLLRKIASIGAMSHSPFIAAAGIEFFGVDSFLNLPDLKDLDSVMQSPGAAAWRGFRESEDARYVGLTLPRFLVRAPYDPANNPIRKFVYREDVSDGNEAYLWGNTAFCFASQLTASFGQYRWCANIIGPKSGGSIEGLPIHTFETMGETEIKIPVEALISDRREVELAEAGFIPLTMRKGSDNAAFFSANSAQKPKNFSNTEEGKSAELNYKLGTQLPYLFMTTRMAHYIKVLQREYIGAWREKSDLNRELNAWIRQYVANQENPSSEIRSRRPFKGAGIKVDDADGDPGWYRVTMFLRPHFKYMGANFELSLVGKLEKEE